MDASPKVSIVIPVYNGSDYLREAVDSALAQSWRNLEVIVVDDGSDDGGKTEEIARSYGERIRYFRKENGGVASALNRGIREMKGDFFAWLSHDDVYPPGRIKVQVEAMRAAGRDVLLYGDYALIDGAGRRLGVTRVGFIRERDFRMALVLDIPVNGCTVLVPRVCLGEKPPFDERLRVAQDYDLWFRLAGRHEFLHMRKELLLSRVHPGQGTRSMPEVCLAEGNGNFIRFLDVLEQEYGDGSPGWFVRFLYRAAVRLKRRGYLEASRHALDLYLRRSGRGGAGSLLDRAALLPYYEACTRPPFRQISGLYRKACESFS